MPDPFDPAENVLSPQALQAIQERITHDFADMMGSLSVDVSIAVQPGTPAFTTEQLLAKIDEIDRNRPIVFCTPEHQEQLTAIAEQAGLAITVKGSPLCPAGRILLHIPPGFRPPTRGEFGYAIDHQPAAARCCETHNTNCEPPGDLCCSGCPEVDHYRGLTHRPCVLDRCSCTSTEMHIANTRPGWAGAEIGMRESA